MKIRNGKLKIGIWRLYNQNEGKISIQELEKLVRDTLKIHPLGNIFCVSYIGKIGNSSIPNFILNKIKNEKNLDIISIIGRDIKPRYSLKEKIVYSVPNPAIFAHELCHAVGLLEHISSECGREKKCSEINDMRACSFSKYIMGCAGGLGRTGSFSYVESKKLGEMF